MTTITATVQDVETRANQLISTFNLIRFLLILLSVPFIVLGWVARLVYRAVLVVAVWVYAAVEIGWKRAAPKAHT